MESSWVGMARRHFLDEAGEQLGYLVNSWEGSGRRLGWENKGAPDLKEGVNNIYK